MASLRLDWRLALSRWRKLHCCLPLVQQLEPGLQPMAGCGQVAVHALDWQQLATALLTGDQLPNYCSRVSKPTAPSRCGLPWSLRDFSVSSKSAWP